MMQPLILPREPSDYKLVKEVKTDKLYRGYPDKKIPEGYEEIEYYESHGIKVPAITNGRLLPQLWALPRLMEETK